MLNFAKKVFKFGSLNFPEGKWSYAAKNIPKSALIDTKCNICGVVRNYPTKELGVILEEGRLYPDVLLNGPWPMLIVSERVLNDWREANVTGFDHCEVFIEKVLSSKLKELPKPRYYRIFVKGRCIMDFNRMGVKVEKVCKECGKRTYNRPTYEFGECYMKESDWDGSDLFTDPFFTGFTFVTEKVLMLACKKKHTNCEFILANKTFLWLEEDIEPIDYLNYC